MASTGPKNAPAIRRWSRRSHRTADPQAEPRERCHRYRTTDQRRLLHVRPRVRLHRVLRLQHHLHRRRCRHVAAPGLPHRATRRAIGLRGTVLPAAQGLPAHPEREGELRGRPGRRTRYPPRCARHGRQLLARCPPHGHHDGVDRCLGRGVPPGARHHRRGRPLGHLYAAHRQDADLGGADLSARQGQAVPAAPRRPRATRKTSSTPPSPTTRTTPSTR